LDEREIAAFEKGKQMMIDVVLWMPDLNKEFIICTDGQETAWGLLLLQEDAEFLKTHPQSKAWSKTKLVSFTHTHGAEKNYSTLN